MCVVVVYAYSLSLSLSHVNFFFFFHFECLFLFKKYIHIFESKTSWLDEWDGEINREIETHREWMESEWVRDERKEREWEILKGERETIITLWNLKYYSYTYAFAW